MTRIRLADCHPGDLVQRLMKGKPEQWYYRDWALRCVGPFATADEARAAMMALHGDGDNEDRADG